MDNFAFVIHPVNTKQDVSRKYPLLGHVLSERMIDYLSKYFPPIKISHIQGIVSQETGKEIEGWFIACPLTPTQMQSLPTEFVYHKIIQAGKMAQDLGARVLGLGGFTSVIGDAGVTVAQSLDIPVTTGNSYTISVAIEATKKAATQMHINLSEATVAIVGATGSIGRVCAQLLVSEVGRLILIGQKQAALNQVKQTVAGDSVQSVHTSTDLSDLKQCDVVLSVTNSIETIIHPHHLKAGSIICDVARPRDVSQAVAQKRDDVLVIEGGLVQVPGTVNFNFNFGLPSNLAFACMAETMLLALDSRYESYTLGKNITLAQVEAMTTMATRHGFRVNGFRSRELPITDETITQVRLNSRARQAELHLVNP